MRIVPVTRAIALGVVVWGLSGIHSVAQGTDPAWLASRGEVLSSRARL